ncbi:hypothetical protein F7734_24135 [Scytonema sp. UIC 10036]|nr:hypothetical protein [Scytonema sp. UIC 10036]MUG95283.1 hypothetical protein [Scytonema sp. UIC 10036]
MALKRSIEVQTFTNREIVRSLHGSVAGLDLKAEVKHLTSHSRPTRA